jgi:SAM-dependent methyltransferase
MVYRPRPEANDLVKKYHFLRTDQQITDYSDTSNSLGKFLERDRAKQIYKIVQARHSGPIKKILDYGGGKGSMMLPFFETGAQCSVVDYYPNQLPGIQKISDDWNDFPKDLRFDVILCNHVLEHVAEPLEMLKRLRSLLLKDGVLYAEVPLEIWGGIPLEKEPVTHVNYYTLESFETMFRLAQLDILTSKAHTKSVVAAPMEVGWVLAKKNKGETFSLTSPLGQKTWNYLLPSRRYSFRRLLRVYVFAHLKNRWRSCFSGK